MREAGFDSCLSQQNRLDIITPCEGTPTHYLEDTLEELLTKLGCRDVRPESVLVYLLNNEYSGVAQVVRAQS
jgi:hypothetical protein